MHSTSNPKSSIQLNYFGDTVLTSDTSMSIIRDIVLNITVVQAMSITLLLFVFF